MAFATVSSEPASQLLNPVPSVTPSERSISIPASPPGQAMDASPIVHLIHPDDAAAQTMARSWACLGATTRHHANAADFTLVRASDVPGCLVVHVAFEDSNTVAAALDHPAQNTRLPMIVTADRADIRTAVLAMKAGAVDFFAMPLCDRDLGEAVAIAIDNDRVRRAADGRRGELLARFATLTRREREVMALVTQGLLNKQVAGDLGLSEVTVKVHRGAAMRKMRARTIADLVRMADALESCADLAT